MSGAAIAAVLAYGLAVVCFALIVFLNLGAVEGTLLPLGFLGVAVGLLIDRLSGAPVLIRKG